MNIKVEKNLTPNLCKAFNLNENEGVCYMY